MRCNCDKISVLFIYLIFLAKSVVLLSSYVTTRLNMERSIRKWVLWILIDISSDAIGFLFLTQHTTPLLYVKIHLGVLHMRGTDVTRSDTP